MFQGRKELRQQNWDGVPFEPSTVHAVILTHAHIDHIGYLPKLSRDGFVSKVYATPPTLDIARLNLLDSAHIQEEDADYRNRKKLTRHKKALPLFEKSNVEDLNSLFQAVRFGKWTNVAEGIRFRFHIVGHILGAASVELEVNDGQKKKTILFSGDIGRYGNPLTRNPKPPPEADYLICESTYGGKIHKPEDPYYIFEQIIHRIVETKGILLVPSFAIGRTQQMIYLVHDLISHDRIPKIDIHVDSPMAVNATEIYMKFSEYHAIDLKCFGGNDCVFNGDNVHLHRDRKSSKALNKMRGPAIILSASGMLTGGRILHHLINRLPQAENIMAFVGFAAEGTLGRRLMDGEKEVYIHKRLVKVKATVAKLSSLSGHADYHEILHWLEPIKDKKPKVFVTHGEPDGSEAMAQHLKEQFGWEIHIPTLHETVEL